MRFDVDIVCGLPKDDRSAELMNRNSRRLAALLDAKNIWYVFFFGKKFCADPS